MNSCKSIFALCGIVAVISFLVPCSRVIAQTSTAPNVAVEDVESYIDPSIQGHERDVMRDIIRALPIEYRENVTHFNSDGSVYGNNPSSKQTSSAIDAGNGLFTYDNIHFFAPPPNEEPLPGEISFSNFPSDIDDDISPLKKSYCFNSPLSNFIQFVGTGPYRRVTSKTGYSSSSQGITLPHLADIAEFGNDTAYVYTGIIGSVDLDAGFQHSPTYNLWSLFIRIDSTHFNPAPLRYIGGRNVDIIMFVPSDGIIALVGTGLAVPQGGGNPVVKTQTLTANAFVRRDGVGQSIKRMTSIGQKPQNFKSGSFIRNVDWLNCRIGTNTSGMVPWKWLESPVSQRNALGYNAYPGNPPVSWTYRDPSNEKNFINLL